MEMRKRWRSPFHEGSHLLCLIVHAGNGQVCHLPAKKFSKMGAKLMEICVEYPLTNICQFLKHARKDNTPSPPVCMRPMSVLSINLVNPKHFSQPRRQLFMVPRLF